jgi:DNA polymerase-3 subunit delta'
MIDDTVMSSVEFNYKFYIFENAEAMTVQAQNALLKIMEEPPDAVKIILLTQSADSMLTTIRSRARILRMQRFYPEEIAEYLKRNESQALALAPQNDEELRTLLLSANGSIGKAISLLSPQSRTAIKKERDEILTLLTALTQKSYAALWSALSALPQKREELSRALLLFHTAIRDLITMKQTETPVLCFFPSPDAISEPLTALRVGTLFAFIDATADTVEELEKNANIQATLTAFAARLRNIQKVR